jgi:branched-chain amino acid transport system permease protein
MSDSRSLQRIIADVAGPCLFTLALTALPLAFGTYVQYVASLCLIAAVVGVAMVLIVGFARVIMLTSGALMAVGAYASTILVERLGVPYLVSLLAAAAFGGLAGAVVAIPASRFRGQYLAMATLVFQFVIIIGLREWSSLTGGAAGLSVQNAELFGYRLSSDRQYLVFIGVASTFAVAILATILSGQYGKALRAISATEIGAQSFGIHVARYHLVAFVISSAAIGFAGALLAPRVRILDPESFGIVSSIFMLAYPVVGGMHSVWGGLLGGAILRALPEALRAGQELQGLIYAVLVLTVMTFFPRGLIGAVAGLVAGLARHVRGDRQNIGPRPAARVAAAPASAPTVPIAGGAALEIEALSMSFGALRAVDHLSLDVRAGRIQGLIGPNGAGKTTLFNCMSRLYQYQAGDILLEGHSLNHEPIHRIASLGLGRTFQNLAMFRSLSVTDNVMVGAHARSEAGFVSSALRLPAVGAEEKRLRERAHEIMDYLGLTAFARRPAGDLPFATQKRVELGRALAAEPKLLMLDEPAAGLNHEELEALDDVIRDIRDRWRITVLLVEHHMSLVMSLSDHIVVLNFGRKIAEGTPEKIQNHHDVIEAYLGAGANA